VVSVVCQLPSTGICTDAIAGDIPTACARTACRVWAKSAAGASAAVAKPLVLDALRAVRASIACLYIVL
jgi:hypothetical protein